MKIKSKKSIKFLQKAVFCLLGAISAIVFISVSGWINNIFGAIAVLISLVVLLKGYLYLFDIKECKGEDYNLLIKNDILYINQKPVNLKGKYLFLESLKCDEYFKVFLYEEKETKTDLILKAILDEKEYIALLKLIKPYKKLPFFLSETKGIFLCKEGFAIDGREFFYDEVDLLEWEIKKSNCKFGYCTKKIYVKFKLKNGDLIFADYKINDLVLAKLLYLKKMIENMKIDENHKFLKRLKEKIKKDECENLIPHSHILWECILKDKIT